jgi:hypothetical protein
VRRTFSILVALVATFAIAGVAMAAHPTFNASAAPNGTHVQTGTPNCTVFGLTIECDSYELAGVGNTDATVALNASYSATVECTNKGGKMVPVKSQSVPAGAFDDELEAKNGRLAVPEISVSAPSTQSFLDAATCPNGNWTKDLQEGSPTLDSWVYTLTFDGFTAAYITIRSPH